MSELIAIVLLCGAGTFLLRLIPIWRARRQKTASATPHRLLQAFLRGIGPAAITALLVVSVWPMVKSGGLPERAATAAALAVILALKRLTGGIAGPTLGGAVVYGGLMHWALG